MLEKVRSQAIRNVNDRLRTTLSFGRIHIAGEMRALRSRDFATVLRKVRLYDSFTKVAAGGVKVDRTWRCNNGRGFGGWNEGTGGINPTGSVGLQKASYGSSTRSLVR